MTCHARVTRNDESGPSWPAFPHSLNLGEARGAASHDSVGAGHIMGYSAKEAAMRQIRITRTRRRRRAPRPQPAGTIRLSGASNGSSVEELLARIDELLGVS